MWHQIPFIRALQRLQNPPDELNHCLCLFTWYVTYKCTKYKTFKDKCFTQKEENVLSNQSKCYGFQLRCNCRCMWGSYQLTINTMWTLCEHCRRCQSSASPGNNGLQQECSGAERVKLGAFVILGDLRSGLIHGISLGKEQHVTMVTTP